MHITQSLLLFFKSDTILLIVFVLNNLYHLKGFENYGGFLLFFYSHIFSSPCDIRWCTISLWKHCYLFCYTIATQQYSMLPQSIILFFWFVSYRSKCLKMNFLITVETFKLDSSLTAAILQNTFLTFKVESIGEDISEYNQVCWKWSNKLCSKTKLNKLQLLPPGFPCTKLDTFIALCFYMKENNIVLQLRCLSLSFGFEYICLSIMNWLYGMILLCYWRPNCELKENPLDSYS